jgi:hypothetical protein
MAQYGMPKVKDIARCNRLTQVSTMPWTKQNQEHILKCHHVGAHKKWYDLVHPLIKIQQNNLCPTQEVFTKCIRSWLESPETIILDVSSVHVSQRELIWKAIANQEQIGWHMAMKGYTSKYWWLAVSANNHLEEDNDKGEAWVRKTVMSLWDFANEMWSIATQFYATSGVSCHARC